MEPDLYQELLTRIGPKIAKKTCARAPLPPAMMLNITLRFLATGNSYRDLEYQFLVSHNTISKFVPVVCEAIVDEYKDEQMNTPTTPAGWMEKEREFANRWQWHHCCGAIDGKHVRIIKPDKAGTNYYCHKGFHSIILLAVVDAKYKFIWADVGAPGSESDCGVFNLSSMEPALREGTLGLPEPSPLPGDNRNTPYFLVGDDAFPLRKWMMKPYPHRYLEHDEQIFNYRCSRGRRVVENGFGILSARWRCLLGELNVSINVYLLDISHDFFYIVLMSHNINYLYFNACCF